MLRPKIQKVSSKGQVVIPADFRHLFGIEKTARVMVVPLYEEKKIIIKPVPKDPIKAAAGMLSAWKKSATQIMREAREEERKIEKKKLKKLSF